MTFKKISTLKIFISLVMALCVAWVAQAAPTQHVLVTYKLAPGAQGRSAVESQATSEVRNLHGVNLTHLRFTHDGADVLRLDRELSEADMNALLTTLRANPNVAHAEPDRMLQAIFTPNDTQYAQQWHYFESTAGINAPTAWDTSTGSGVVVAVIDTGYRPHADLAANILQGYDFIGDTTVSNDGDGRDSDASDPGDWTGVNECGSGWPGYNSSWHGTHTAGTIAAVTNNGIGVAGVAFNAKIVPARVLGKCGGYTSDISDAIVWASGGTVSGVPANANPAKVISMSLGGSGSC
ncbi:MAG TPA: S8 family serine peptidase, partial [Steroidobacteraceae bacterium]|nr:S8 family serine peptidase [Steroidobacteraceae bacterium]